MTNYFIFNGESSLNYGIKVPELPPRMRAPRRTVKTIIPGRSGTYTYNEKNDGEYVYESYLQSWEIVIKDERDIDKALEWLSGSGEIIFSDELDKAYTVDFSEQISLSRVFKKWHRGPISCEFQPFKRDISPIEITIDGSGTVTKRFKVDTQRKVPLQMTLSVVDKTQSVHITLNGESLTIGALGIISIPGLPSEIIIDSELQSVRVVSGQDLGGITSGKFPLKLINGFNEIAVTNAQDTHICYRGIYL